MIAVAVDVGGTFTDVVALDTVTGEGHSLKVPSTPGRLADAVIEGTVAALERAAATPGDVARFVHSG